MKRNMGIIIILVGVGILFISVFFSSGYHTGLNFIGNISQMEIVIDEGKYPETPAVEEESVTPEEEAPPVVEEEAVIEEVRERVAIPLKYPLSLSVVLILLGTGIILISKNKETNA
jgi:hypothetical protein